MKHLRPKELISSVRVPRKTSNVTVTHNGTSLILPGGADITVENGDQWEIESDTIGNWRVTNIFKAAGPVTRVSLTANRTYYVRTDGSDSNNGLVNTSGGAFLTIQKAYNVIAASLDLSGFTVTIQIADGTYTSGLAITGPWSGGGAIVVQGNSGTPSNVLISVTNSNAIINSATLPGTLTIKDLKLQSTTSGALLVNSGVGLMVFNNLVFGAAASSAHIAASGPASRITGSGNYSITGGGTTHNEAIYGGLVLINGVTVTITGNPTFASAFAFAWRTGTVDIYNNTYNVTGSVTATRSNAIENGVIITGGQSNTAYPPGSSNGVTASGGQRT